MILDTFPLTFAIARISGNQKVTKKVTKKISSVLSLSMAMLLLFVLSATITGSLVLARPIHLYLSGAKKEAVQLLIATLAFLFLLTLITFAIQLVS